MQSFCDVLEKLKLGRPYTSVLEQIDNLAFQQLSQYNNAPKKVYMPPRCYRDLMQDLHDRRQFMSPQMTGGTGKITIFTIAGPLDVVIDLNVPRIILK